MKTNFLLILFLCFFYVNSQIVKELRISTESIKEINLKSIPKVILKKGNNFILEIESEKQDQNRIITELSNNELQVYIKPNKKRNNSNILIYLTIPEDIKELTIKANSVSELIGEEVFKISTLNLFLNSVNNFNLQIDSEKLYCNANSVVHQKITGNVSYAKIELNSTVDFNVKNLIINNLDLNLNSSIKSFFYVKNELNLKSNSSMKTIISGNPKIINKKIDNSSTVTFE